MKDGQFEATEVGSPQGGVISPLLSNVYLNVFDQEMMRRGIRIVRYADDILIFAKTRAKAVLFAKLFDGSFFNLIDAEYLNLQGCRQIS